MGDTFDCAQCGGTFPKEWSDEEARAESRDNGYQKMSMLLPPKLYTGVDGFN